MKEWIRSKLSLEVDSISNREYVECIHDMVWHEMVQSMKNYMQHGKYNCLEHSLYVSYISYLICRRLELDYRSAARGGLLHDFFLYDWHVGKPYRGLHGVSHPYISLQNASKFFNLNAREMDIIQKHMWPLTFRLPRYKETFIVLLADKYCASAERIKFGSIKIVNKLKEIIQYT